MKLLPEVIRYFTTECEPELRSRFLAVLQCAPVLNYIKPSVLFAVGRQEGSRIRNYLKGHGIKVWMVQTGKGTELLLCYRTEMLKTQLEDSDIRFFLRERGYPQCAQVDEMLHIWSRRIKNYESGKESFPHETGIFLGYPFSDVVKFMEHKGQYAADCEYWKVYDNLLQARMTFSLYDKAKIFSINRFLSGKMIEQRETL